MLSGDLLQLVLKDDVSYIVVVFDEYIPLELRCIFDSTNSDKLSCKRDTEEIISCEYSFRRPFLEALIFCNYLYPDKKY